MHLLFLPADPFHVMCTLAICGYQPVILSKHTSTKNLLTCKGTDLLTLQR